jgi:outer membrane protein OmpA-like peptidoglycan-associated protein
MIETAIQNGPDEAEDNGLVPDELSELRGLLIAPEQTQLRTLQDQLTNPVRRAQDVGNVLAEAVAIRTAQDDQLTSALMPTVEQAITISVRRDPTTLVDAIFPVMGPAIRKAIAQAFSEMVQSLNQALDHSISIKGLRWRIEALRTGRPFAEVVLSHTLLYRVEQVFLIHKETGLLLQNAIARAVEFQDPDLVSGMLTAIQDFVKESFGGGKDDHLEAVEVGDLDVWIEQGPLAVLAVVIRGTAPKELRRVMQDAIERIHLDHRAAIECFSGDVTPLAACRPHLESCLLSHVAGPDRKPSRLLLALAVVVLAAVGLWLFFSIRSDRRWNDYLDRLRAEPGIVVVSAERRGGKHHITGLRDPLAADPAAILKATSLDQDDVASQWEFYHAAHPSFVIPRANALLQPPSTATLRFEDGVLHAEGVASRAWTDQARRLTALLPGVTRFESDRLADSDQFESVRRRLEQRTVQFDLGSAEIAATQNAELDQAASEIKMLDMVGRSLGKRIRVEITGQADQTGSRELNERLIRQRADQTMTAMISRGISADQLSIAGSDPARTYARKATFGVVLPD